MNDFIRLKCNTSATQLEDRLQYRPHTIELHLIEQDLLDIPRLKNIIKNLNSKGIHVVLHQPFHFNGLLIDINDIEYGRDAYFYQLGIMNNLCEELNVDVVWHGNYKYEFGPITKEISEETFRRISNISGHLNKHILWENAIWSSFSYDNPYIISDIIEPLNLNLCFDISHAFISLNGDNDKLLSLVKQVDKYVKHYHVVDSMGVYHDSLTLGEGKIDFKQLKPFVEKKSYIFEINLENQNDCKEMIKSVEYFNKL